MWPFSRCSRYRHADPVVVGLGAEIRGDIRMNSLKPWVRFYLECRRCGATAERLREAVQTYHTLDDLVLNGLDWDEEDA
jgi:hypothetical protein